MTLEREREKAREMISRCHTFLCLIVKMIIPTFSLPVKFSQIKKSKTKPHADVPSRESWRSARMFIAAKARFHDFHETKQSGPKTTCYSFYSFSCSSYEWFYDRDVICVPSISRLQTLPPWTAIPRTRLHSNHALLHPIYTQNHTTHIRDRPNT